MLKHYIMYRISQVPKPAIDSTFCAAFLAVLLCLPVVNAKDSVHAPSEPAVVLTPSPSSGDHGSATIETLLKTSESWDGTPYGAYPPGTPEVTILKIVIPPHTALPWHTHPILNAAYVVSGELTVETEGGKTQHLSAGQVLPESVGIVHRGYTGDNEVTLIVFYAGAQEMKLNELAY